MGCEGLSEVYYGRYLQHHADQLGVNVHIDNKLPMNQGGGDPLAIVERSVKHIKRTNLKREPYKYRFIFLDDDITNNRRNNEAIQLAENNGIRIYRQKVNYEGFILNHLPGCVGLMPDKDHSEFELKRIWPEYNKPMDSRSLINKIPLSGLISIVNKDDEFKDVLVEMGFIFDDD